MKNNYVDINEEWGRLRAIVKDSLKTGRQQATPYVIHSTYNGILEIMRCAANRYLKAQRCEILEKRIFTYSPETLRCVAEEFGVSHERIRQLQNSSWKRLSTGIYKGVEFESYRESLKKILMSVPSDMLVSTIRGITLLNQSIGEWLYMIVVEDDETDNQSTL